MARLVSVQGCLAVRLLYVALTNQLNVILTQAETQLVQQLHRHCIVLMDEQPACRIMLHHKSTLVLHVVETIC